MESVINKEKSKAVDEKECQHEWKYEGDEMRGHYNSLYERNLYTCAKCGKQKYSKF